MNRLKFILFFCMAMLVFPGMLCADNGHVIMVINSDASVKKYRAAQEAFKKAIKQPVREINLNEKQWKDPDEVRELIWDEDPSLIYCIGIKAYSFARENAGEKRIILPSEKHVVFSSILNWLRLEPLPERTYGISEERHPGMQITLFRHLFPNVKKIGVLFSGKYTKEWYQNTKNTAREIGVDIIGYEVSGKDSVSKIKKLLPNADAFWLKPDPVITPDKEILIKLLQECDRQKIPVFSSREELAKFGAVLIVSVDNHTIGWQAANIASKVLSGDDIGQKVQVPGGSRIILNLEKVKEYNLEYNEDALSSVDKIEKQVLSADAPLPEIKGAYAGIDEEMRWLQAETFVITASRVWEHISKSAASITVVTDEQIRQMGARHLMDVLRTVPGMSFHRRGDGQYKIDTRGIGKSAGQDILLMINSHPINENFTGSAVWTHDTMIVENIKQIEFIRGPGSALYGANAFSGVINIITKDGQDIDGVQISASRGSYNTQQYNLLFGKTFKDIEFAVNFNFYETDGFEGYIERDRQTYLDNLLGTNASLAPGYTSDHEKKNDISFKGRYKKLTFDARYVDRERDQTISMLDALSDECHDGWDDYYLNLGYDMNIWERFDTNVKVYRNHNYFHSYYKIFPNGTRVITPDGIEILPEGMIGVPSNKNARTGIEIQTTYKPNISNTIVTGITYERMKQYDVRLKANYLYTDSSTVIKPLDFVVDITDRQNYNKSVSRTFKAVFFENIWDINDDVRFTVGARYDSYSDFGDSLNPRAGLIWRFGKDYNLKILYGRAFRAPSFYELYNKNNPLIEGNSDLKPEKIETYELSAGAEFTFFNAQITGFQNTIKDNIDIFQLAESQGKFKNEDSLRINGAEAELKLDFGKGIYFAMNYTYQDCKNWDTRERLYFIPKHKGNIMANIRLSKYLNLYSDFHFQKDFTREEGDDRDSHPGISIFNTTVIAKQFIPGYEKLEIRGSVYNLFDKSYTFPYEIIRIGEEIRTVPDLPMDGRNFILEVRYTF
ncbi:MAG: TonB-dependent receptor [Desulfobacterales bacterium]|nr:TonB-dependent receptor [Desulfobacterales bacterium]